MNPIGDGKVYHAYTYATPDRVFIGYLRIPTWDYPGLEGEAELDEILQFFEENVDGIVIDQVNNPGGSLIWTYGFASRFTQQTFAAPQTRFLLEYDNAASYYQNAQGSPEEFFTENGVIQDWQGLFLDRAGFKSLTSYFQFLYDEIMEGKKLSSPYPYFGLSNINPHPVTTVTKPVLMLVNELSMSGGDFTPAIMQANGMAKIFGVRTRGAGGHIFETDVGFNVLGVQGMVLTHSLSYFPNSTEPIENHGVTPDVPYQLTVADIKSGYAPMGNAINGTIVNMIREEALERLSKAQKQTVTPKAPLVKPQEVEEPSDDESQAI